MFTCHELFAFMPQALALEILGQAFTSDRESYRVALNAVAEARKLRPVFFQRKPRTDRHKEMLATLCHPQMEAVAGQLLRSWLLKTQEAMLANFLDGLGVAHEHGVANNFPPSVEDAKLEALVTLLLSKYPQEKVVVYLNVFCTTCEARWPNLTKLLQTDARLQLS